jgi:dTDP-4-dehydrorhamnose 3,5-epimerase-like enzyme
MKITATGLACVLILTPNIYRGSRGAFSETWNLRGMVEVGLPSAWVQDNFSVSRRMCFVAFATRPSSRRES